MAPHMLDDGLDWLFSASLPIFHCLPSQYSAGHTWARNTNCPLCQIPFNKVNGGIKHQSGNIIFYRCLLPCFLHLKKSSPSINFILWYKITLFFTFLLPHYSFHSPIIPNLLIFLVFSLLSLPSSSFPSSSFLSPLFFFFWYVHVYFPYNMIHFLWTWGRGHSNKWLYLLSGWVNKWMNGQNK